MTAPELRAGGVGGQLSYCTRTASGLMSGHMSDNLGTEPTRRLLTARQADMVQRLTEAGAEEIRASGYENLSIRDVARRAGVAAATAYTYFSSRDHLLTEIFWRRLSALPPVEPVDTVEPADAAEPADAVETAEAVRRPPRTDQVIAVLRELSLLVSEEPELAQGCTAAMFGSEPDVRQLRLYIGRRIHQRIEAAAGPGSPQARLLELAYFGAMVEAGLGYTTYKHMADRLAEAARLIMG
jgi:AcrR family transcriptional regulator